MTENITPKKRAAGGGRKAAPKSGAVRSIRAALGLTQEQMAAQLGCTFSALRVMERQGRLPGEDEPIKKLKRLSKQTGISLDPEPESEVAAKEVAAE